MKGPSEPQAGHILVIVALLLFAGAAVLLAVKISPIAALVFCTSTGAWVLLGLWYTGRSDGDHYEIEAYPERQNYSEQKRTPVVRVAVERDRPQAPPQGARPQGKTRGPQIPKGNEDASSYAQPKPGSDLHTLLADGIVQITRILTTTNDKLSRFEGIMSKRMHKTTNNEHLSMLSAKKIMKALEDRLDLLNQQMSAFEHGREDKQAILELLNADLIVAHDPLTALPGEQPLPPIARSEWESTLNILCKQIARKPSFLRILRQKAD